MTTHVSCLELMFGHEGRQPSYMPELSRPVSFVDLPVDNASGLSDPLPQPVIPLSCYYGPDALNQRGGPVGTFIGTISNATPGVSTAIADGMNGYWSIEGAYEANSAVPGIFPAYGELEYGRNAPPVRAGFAADALTAARGGSTLVGLSGCVTYAYGPANPYMGLAHVCDFEDAPPDGDDNGTQIVTRITRALQSPSNSVDLGTDPVGNPIIVKDCCLALVDPSATVYVMSTDLGVGPSQIPPSVGDNLASRFRAHPSVFIRSARARYCRSVVRQYRDQVAINTQASGLPIRIVELDAETPPTYQNWLIIVDGVPMIVQVDITGYASQRPRDVWNQFWVPLIHSDSSVGNAPLTDFPTAINTVLRGPAASQLRLKFLEYARCLPMPGTNITQTDSGPA